MLLLPGEGDAGRRDGAERAGGAGVVPEPEGQGENERRRLEANSFAPSGCAINQAPRRVLKLIAAFLVGAF